MFLQLYSPTFFRGFSFYSVTFLEFKTLADKTTEKSLYMLCTDTLLSRFGREMNTIWKALFKKAKTELRQFNFKNFQNFNIWLYKRHMVIWVKELVKTYLWVQSLNQVVLKSHHISLKETNTWYKNKWNWIVLIISK